MIGYGRDMLAKLIAVCCRTFLTWNSILLMRLNDITTTLTDLVPFCGLGYRWVVRTSYEQRELSKKLSPAFNIQIRNNTKNITFCRTQMWAVR